MAPMTSQITSRTDPIRMSYHLSSGKRHRVFGRSWWLGKYQGKRFLNTLTVAAEQFPEPAAAAMQAAHDRADWAVHHLRYFPVAEPLHVGQVNRHAEVFGKLPQRVGHAGVRYAVKGQFFRGTAGHRGLRGTRV